MEENQQQVEEPVQPTEPTEEPVQENSAPTTQEPLEMVTADAESLEALQALNETMTWNTAFQVVLVCILLFQLFFTSMKAGK